MEIRVYKDPSGLKYFKSDLEAAAVRAGFPANGYNKTFLMDLASYLTGASKVSEEALKRAAVELSRIQTFIPYNDGDKSRYYLLEKPSAANGGTTTTTSIIDKKADWALNRLREVIFLQDKIANTPTIPGLQDSSLSPLDRAFKTLNFLREERRKEIALWKASLDKESKAGEKEDPDAPNITILPYDPILGEVDGDQEEYLDFMLVSKLTNRSGAIHAFTDKTLRELLQVSTYMRDVRQISDAKHTLQISPTGPLVRYRAAKGMEDLHLVDAEYLVMGSDVLVYNLINGDVPLKRRYRRKSEVSIINVLIDRSGSMQSETKSVKALGILWYLVKQVIAKKAIVVFSFFEKTADNFHVLDYREMSRAELLDWFQHVMHSPFEGGTTDVGGSAVKAIKKFKELMLTPSFSSIEMSKAHLILVNDGEDDAHDLTVDMLHELEATLHGFILFNSNSHIQHLSKSTGGFYCEGI